MLSTVNLIVLLTFCLKFLVSAVDLSATSHQPGKVLLWSYNSGTHHYNTKSMTISSAMNIIQEVAKDYEMIVVLNPSKESKIEETSFLTDHLKDVNNLHVINYVYPTSVEESSIPSSLKDKFKPVSTHTTHNKDDFQSALSTAMHNKMILNNKVPDFIEIQHHHEMTNVYSNVLKNEIPDSLKSKVLFVSFVDISPVSSSSAVSGADVNSYSSSVASSASTPRRMLASNSSSDSTYNSTLPEGTEFSIYFFTDKDHGYLYLTPDIFTGLMTSLFMCFTILIGLRCLGEIQGMSAFYEKQPLVGREA
jgi:hypothetical protein